MTKITRILIAFLLFNTTLFAQIPGLTQFTTNNGLPSNTIYDIVQDENGFIWFATDYGVSKFDGLTFKNFTVTDGLPGNEILAFYKDSKNRIWMISFNGNVGFIQNNHFYNKDNLAFLSQLQFPKFIDDIFEDSKGKIWFCQNSTTLKVLNTDLSIKKYSANNDINLTYTFLFIEDIHQKVHLLTYLNNEKKINVIAKPLLDNIKLSVWKDFNASQFPYSTLEKINNNFGMLLREKDEIIKNISKYIIHENNSFLARTYKIGKDYWVTNLNKGVYIFNEADNYHSPKKILKNTQSTRAYIDSENNIWIGTQSNGIFLFPNLKIQGIQFDDAKKNDLHSVNLFQNKLILGNDLNEVIILNKETLQTIEILKLDNNNRRIRHLKVGKNQLIILGDNNIARLNSNLKLESVKNMYDVDFIKSNLKNFKSLSTVGDDIYTANSNGVAKINRNTLLMEKLWDKRSTSIFYQGNDRLWIGTTKGLYLQNKGETKKYNIGNQFNESIIYSLEKNTKGLLIGSNAYGLGILKNGKFKTISTSNGLLSNYIKSIFMDAKNNIWLSTNLGLNRLELDNNNNLVKLKTYTISDGLYSNDVRACYVDENKVYVATSNGLNIIDISKEENFMLAPKIHINEILLNNNIIEKTNNQTFDHQSNNIQFDFSGISFKSLGNITFKYRLLGLEPDWIDTKNNTVRYSSLPPNNYTFEVIAVSKNNLESSNPAIFSFEVKQPVYKTWWFIAVSILILLLFIANLFYKRKQKIKQNEKIKENISNLRYKALNAQMNPHFINNLLVNIDALASKGELEEVKGSLGKFAELVNLILQSTKSNLINLTDEIEMAKLYLELQKLRFHKNTTFTINTESISQEELENILVPPMILQPIIENAFKHGFKNGDKENCICVAFKIENDEFLICEISDNGVGIQKNENASTINSSGISFSNINERLQLINGAKNEENLVIISNVTDEFNTLVGLKVTLKIPLISF
ncbi:MAG: two-component regulator propeller domain-containing protein [Lutibacter sp.]|nr:two-component regulator propeller domain-containing protein [Lutibacter sp.]